MLVATVAGCGMRFIEREHYHEANIVRPGHQQYLAAKEVPWRKVAEPGGRSVADLRGCTAPPESVKHRATRRCVHREWCPVAQGMLRLPAGSCYLIVLALQFQSPPLVCGRVELAETRLDFSRFWILPQLSSSVYFI